MLAGFLRAMRTIAPAATFSCCAPFALAPLRQRFPAVDWLPYDDAARSQCVRSCDVWLGLGGSPFQSALSRWFVDHLVGDAALCERERKPMFFLGIGVQTATELKLPEIRRLCFRAAGIWTRDAASGERLRALPSPPPLVEAAADMAHIFFRDFPPPPAVARRVTVVVNFDYGIWPGEAPCLRAIAALAANEHAWLAQETRDLPGAERALYRNLPATEQSRWHLISPERPGSALADVIARWPSGEWLITARYHAALAGAWAGSRIVVLSTNEKLRAAAHDLRAALLSPEADEATATRALNAATTPATPRTFAGSAYAACAAFAREAFRHARI